MVNFDLKFGQVFFLSQIFLSVFIKNEIHSFSFSLMCITSLKTESVCLYLQRTHCKSIRSFDLIETPIRQDQLGVSDQIKLLSDKVVGAFYLTIRFKNTIQIYPINLIIVFHANFGIICKYQDFNSCPNLHLYCPIRVFI